jgi:phosphoribosylformylglycinamidine synthase PurS subunit
MVNPEEVQTLKALHSLKFAGVEGIRMGKCFTLKISGDDEATVRQSANKMCEKLLVNQVSETFEIISVKIAQS